EPLALVARDLDPREHVRDEQQRGGEGREDGGEPELSRGLRRGGRRRGGHGNGGRGGLHRGAIVTTASRGEEARGTTPFRMVVFVETEPDLTVVVLAWNTRDLVLEALRAVDAGAAPRSVETICVDNASADGTAAAVRAAFPQVRLIESPVNLGFARGNDLALPHARGRYVCFLN